jgi:hypothetical protein
LCHVFLPTRRKNGRVIKGRLYRARIKLDGDSKGMNCRHRLHRAISLS